MKVSRKIKGCFGEVITVFPGTFKGVLKEVSRVFHKRFKEEDALRLFHDFQWCFQSVPECFKVFQRCFKEILRELARCFQKVSCCMALIAASRADGGLVSNGASLNK